MASSVPFDKDIFGNFEVSLQRGPWCKAVTVKVPTAQQVVDILTWCKQEMQSDDWAVQPRNNFFDSELIFYFNNIRDYTVFVLKYLK